MLLRSPCAQQLPQLGLQKHRASAVGDLAVLHPVEGAGSVRASSGSAAARNSSGDQAPQGRTASLGWGVVAAAFGKGGRDVSSLHGALRSGFGAQASRQADLQLQGDD